MKPITSCLLFIFSLHIAACSNRIQVTEYPEHFDSSLTTLGSYCWANNTQLNDKQMHQNPIEKIDPTGGHHSAFDALVKTTIDAQLEKKHYQKVACDKAAFHIDYRMNIHEDTQAMEEASSPEQNSTNPYGFKWKISDEGLPEYKGVSGPDEKFIVVRHGTIHVGAFSATHQLIWHSSAEKSINDRDTDETRRENIKTVVQKIMDDFPEKQQP